MIDIAVLLILGFASYRATRFVVFDTLIEGTREKIFLFLINHQANRTTRFLNGKALDLLSCTWCAGFWISLLIAGLYFGELPWYFTRHQWLSTLGITGVQAFIHTVEPDEGDHEH